MAVSFGAPIPSAVPTMDRADSEMVGTAREERAFAHPTGYDRRAIPRSPTMYVAGFVIPVPEEKMEAYRKWAENGAVIFKEYGCIEIVEAWEDNVPSGKYTDFR